MGNYYQDRHITIFNKDCRQMSELPDESVQCVVTSPPYWGLRKYSGEQELIWGPVDCAHQWLDAGIPKSGGVGDYEVGRVGNAMARTASHEAKPSNICSLCGAWKGAFGLEPSPELYISHTIEILREIRRVLRKDGCVWWNIGDSYAGSSTIGGNDLERKYPTAIGKGIDGYQGTRQLGVGMKPKDLCLIPFRIAIACQEAGWWVRSVIIWSKPNPMPESVTDRPTESHEYILMLTKSGTSQYWTHRDGNRDAPYPDYRWQKHSEPDMKAMAKEIGGMSQRTVWEERDGEDRGWREAAERQHSTILEETDIKPEGWTPKNKMGWNRINLWRGHDYYWDADAVREPHLPQSLDRVRHDWNGQRPEMSSWSGMDIHKMCHPGGRNIRSVWEFPTQSYPEAHFAVFPEKLPEICVKAATPEVGCCSKCGAPWERVREPNTGGATGKSWHDHADDLGKGQSQKKSTPPGYKRGGTLGWQPTCKCGKYTCVNCQSVVLYPYREESNATQRPRSKKSLPSGVGKEEVSEQRGSQRTNKSSSPEISKDLRPLREELQGQERQSILQSGLLNEMDVGTRARQQGDEGQALGFATSQDTDKSGVYQEKDARTPASGCSGLCMGTQTCNGEDTREVSNNRGASAPQERNKVGQQTRESSESSEGAHRSSMSPMPAHLPNKETCPNCGSLDFHFEPFDKVPSLCLDPFAGAGTTLWVAKKLNRRAVGYEISEEYCGLALERNRQQVLGL